MELTNIKLICDVFVSFTVIFGIVITISKYVRKKIANFLLKQIDETSPNCYATKAINLSHENLININQISSNISDLKQENNKTSSTLNDIIQRLNESAGCFDNITKSLNRLEILSYIDHHPEEMKQIGELYDKYKKMGGNSYIDLVYKNYIHKHISI